MSERYTVAVLCNGCMKILFVHSMNVEDAIRTKGWDVDEEGILCPKCSKLVTQQASFKGIL